MPLRPRFALIAALVLAASWLGPASAQPVCAARLSADRCPAQQTEVRGETATASALAIDATRGIAVATGWMADKGAQTPVTVGVDVATGRELWRHLAKAASGGAAMYDVATHAGTGRTFVGGHVFVGPQRASATVYAVDTATGRGIWSAREAGPVRAHIDSTQRVLVAADGRTVYAVGTVGLLATAKVEHRLSWRVVAHDAATGRVRWTWTLPDGGDQAIPSDAAIAGGSLVLTGWSAKIDAPVVVLDARTGVVRWRARSTHAAYGGRLTVDVSRGLVVTGHMSWLGEDDQPVRLVARRLSDGTDQWTSVLSAAGEDLRLTALATVDGRFVVAGAGARRGEGLTENDAPPSVPLLAAFDARGRQSWVRRPAEAGSASATGLAGAAGQLYAYGEQDQRPGVPHVAPAGAALLWRLDPATGVIQWTGRTVGRGDQAHSSYGEETVGAVVVGSDVVSLVRHLDLHYGMHDSGAAMLVQRWAG